MFDQQGSQENEQHQQQFRKVAKINKKESSDSKGTLKSALKLYLKLKNAESCKNTSSKETPWQISLLSSPFSSAQEGCKNEQNYFWNH